MIAFVATATALTSVVAGGAFAQVTITPSSVLVKTGDPAPSGRAAPDTFTSFIGSPAVNATGKIAFVAQIAETNGLGNPVSTIWTNRSGSLEMSAVQGTPISPTSTDPARTWAPFASSTTLFLADNGQLVVSALGSPSFPLGSFGRYALMRSSQAGAWSFVAVSGRPLPGYAGQSYFAPLQFPAVRIDNGWVAFPARNSAFNWYFIREGETGLNVVDEVPPPSLSGTPLYATLATSGDFAYTGRYGSGGTSFARGFVGARGPLLAESGQSVTFLNAAGVWSLFPKDGTQPPVNGQAEAVLGVMIQDSGTPGAVQLGAAIRLTPAGAVLLARQGDPIENGGGLQWGDLSRSVPFLSDTGQSVWWTKVAGPGIDSTNDTAVALFGAGPSPTVKILARGGAPAADLPGFTYTNVFTGAMTRYGRVFFGVAVTNALDGSSSATFGVDVSGRPRLLAAALRSSINLPGGGTVPVQSLTGVGPGGGNDGLTRQLTADGRLASAVTYPGGQAIVLLPIPCPADIACTGGVPGYDGVMDNNDFIVFVDRFFNADARADCGETGGVPGSDSVFDNNDFVVFIDQFFDGCE